MHANNREEIKEVRAGDIAAAVGLKDVTTGETLCDIKESHDRIGYKPKVNLKDYIEEVISE